MKLHISRWGFKDRVVERLLLLSAVLLIAAFGVWFMKARSLDREINLGLSIPSHALTFDTAIAQRGFEWTLPVSNTGDETVRVLEFETSCGCTKVEPTTCELQPGETRNVNVTLDLTFVKIEQSSLAEVPFDVTIVPRIEVNQQQVRGVGWRLDGRVRPLIVTTPRVMTLGGSDAVIGSREQEMVATVRTADDISDVEIESRSTELFDVSIAAGKATGEYELRVRPKKSLPVGGFEGQILLRPMFTDGTDAPSVSYFVKGEKLSEIEAVPPIVNFGRRPVGDRGSMRVLVRSRIGREILRIDVLPVDGLHVSPDTEPHGSGEQVLVFQQDYLAAQTFQSKVSLEVHLWRKSEIDARATS
ncbi:MAG: DUF1573 domain-containing protein [Planctomycetia bacterium]|nr:DUF1573 domain-containing protein [Planctomycetia bacterium]